MGEHPKNCICHLCLPGSRIDKVMNKDEALREINAEIVRVEALSAFKGRTNLLMKLNRCYDLVNLYKPNAMYYALIVREAKNLLNELQERLDSGK